MFCTGSLVSYTTYEHSVLKTSEPSLIQLDTGGLRGKSMKRSTSGIMSQRSRSHDAEIGHKSPFWRDISNNYPTYFNQSWQTHNYRKFSLNHNSSDAKSHRSRSHNAEVTFGEGGITVDHFSCISSLIFKRLTLL